jgi:hypothetical protein
MANPNRFYTYAYLREDRTPYYIGKGSGKRAYDKGKCEIKPPKDKSRVIFLKQNLTEEEAFKHETYMIAVFGRKDLGTGILRNKSDGGEGVSGYTFTETQRQSVIKSNKRRTGTRHTEKTKFLMQQKAKGRKLTEETKQKLREKAKLRVGVGWKHKEKTKIKISNANCRYLYELTDPNGEIFITDDLVYFCKKNPQYSLIRRSLCSVVHGKQKQHRGWTVRILENLI